MITIRSREHGDRDPGGEAVSALVWFLNRGQGKTHVGVPRAVLWDLIEAYELRCAATDTLNEVLLNVRRRLDTTEHFHLVDDLLTGAGLDVADVSGNDWVPVVLELRKRLSRTEYFWLFDVVVRDCGIQLLEAS